ncbi:putative membrane protein [Halomicrobium sp. LC1Hm]|nr:putative membrane protein [Halomicrobium sp. LC1Hm]
MTLYLYPALVVATRPLLLLSSTVIVVALLWVWLSVWLSIEIVLEWQTTRVRTQ